MPGLAGNRDLSNPAAAGFPILSFRLLANRPRFRWAEGMIAVVFRLEHIEVLEKRL